MKVLAVMKETVRTHVVLSKSLLDSVDALVGQRRRGQYVEEAISEKLRRDRQEQAIAALRWSGGVLTAIDHPEWATPEQTSDWVRGIRREANQQTVRKVGRDARG